jgi:hypothetical protein
MIKIEDVKKIFFFDHEKKIVSHAQYDSELCTYPSLATNIHVRNCFVRNVSSLIISENFNFICIFNALNI